MTDKPRLRMVVTSWCGYCRAAKKLLEERGIPYEEVDVTGDPERLRELKKKWDWPTVPIVIHDGEVIGGYTELARRDDEQGLGDLAA